MMKTRWMITGGLVGLCGLAHAAFVTISDEGNTADPSTGYGTVGYTYQISATEVTIAQMAAARAADSRVCNGNENYWNDGTHTAGANAPATMVSWYEAARYCNWMTSGNVDAGAYQFNESGTLTNVITRAQILADGGLFYVLPTEDEWYKAAYFKGDAYSLYANGMGTAPIAGIDANYKFAVSSGIWTIGSGTAEQNGTYDMNGNVWEWNESAWDGTLDNLSESRLARGGSFGNSEPLLSSSIRISNNDPSFEHYTLGFRVVAVPEPASAMMMVFGAGVGIAVHRARRNAMRR